ncbi:MAG: hypothetical protein ACKVW3_03925 [Phycisphaerales bacterium]
MRTLTDAWPRLCVGVRTHAVERLRQELTNALPKVEGPAEAARLPTAESLPWAAPNAIALLIGDLGRASHVGLLPGILRSSDESSREAAAAALAHLAGVDDGEWAWSPRETRTPREAEVDRQRLEKALAETLADATDDEFQRPGRAGGQAVMVQERVLEAVAAMLNTAGLAWPGDRPRPLMAWFGEIEGAGREALRRWIRNDESPRSLAAAWTWLPRDHMASACLDRLARRASVQELGLVFERSHMRWHPGRARRLGILPKTLGRGVATRRPLLPDPSAVGVLPARARRGYVEFVATLEMPEAERERRLARCLQDPDAMTRLSAARVLSGAALADYCFDADPAVAASAAIRLACDRAERARSEDTVRVHVMTSLRRSPHAMVRAVAAVDSVDPWDPSSAASRLAARRMLLERRTEFLASLRARLGDAEPRRRIDAISLARRLGMVAEIELELLSRLAASGGARDAARDRVAATAVGALGTLDTSSAASAVRACLRHPEDRVRANAVEVIAPRDVPLRQDRVLYSAMIELRSDGSARVRANAVMGLLRAALPALGGDGVEPEAVHGLMALLCDGREGHRLSGAWAAERVLVGEAGRNVWSVERRRPEIMSRLESMARSDTSEVVRARATRCLERLGVATERTARMASERSDERMIAEVAA